MTTREAGFSLIEVLAAVMVFALVSAISVGLLSGALRSKTQTETALDALAQVQRVNALLRDDLGQLVMRPVRSAEGGTDPRLFALDARGAEAGFNLRRGGAEEVLVLTRTGWANPGGVQPRSGLQRVRWLYDGDTLWREADPYPDAAPGADPLRQPIATGVRDLTLDGLDAADWRDRIDLRAEAADAAPPAPRAVRVRYVHDRLGPMEHVLLTPTAEAET